MSRKRPLPPSVFCLALVLLAVPAASQSKAHSDQAESGANAEAGHLQIYAYSLRNKPAAEAMVLIRPLLSQRGTVELQPEGNTLVVRDSLAALGRIVPALRAYDRPPERLRVQILIVRAFSEPVAVPPARSLPPWLEDRLQGLLRWDHYQVLAEAGLDTREGEDLAHEVGELYGLSFRMGTLYQDERIKLHDFKIWRVTTVSPPGSGAPLLEATLNLWLDKPKVLGLANSESSDHALMVVLTCERLPRPSTSRVSPVVPEEGARRPPGGGL
ncbi:MAG TPA: hypothetical protein VMR44_10145 [Thermoanaerobaculia bacterium]|nr:hypothetical protein [Thermoanaerobaculia bacterium]